jgi:hypothetical protein
MLVELIHKMNLESSNNYKNFIHISNTYSILIILTSDQKKPRQQSEQIQDGKYSSNNLTVNFWYFHDVNPRKVNNLHMD